MYLGGKFYSLHVKHNLRDLDQGLDNVDHHLLDKYIFKPILGINDYEEEENSKMNFVKEILILKVLSSLKNK